MLIVLRYLGRWASCCLHLRARLPTSPTAWMTELLWVAQRTSHPPYLWSTMSSSASLALQHRRGRVSTASQRWRTWAARRHQWTCTAAGLCSAAAPMRLEVWPVRTARPTASPPTPHWVLRVSLYKTLHHTLLRQETYKSHQTSFQGLRKSPIFTVLSHVPTNLFSHLWLPFIFLNKLLNKNVTLLPGPMWTPNQEGAKYFFMAL